MRTLVFVGIGWLILLTIIIERLVLDGVDSLLMKHADQEIEHMCQPLTIHLTTKPEGGPGVLNRPGLVGGAGTTMKMRLIFEFHLAGDPENGNFGERVHITTTKGTSISEFHLAGDLENENVV
jgi:hypothetical protein